MDMGLQNMHPYICKTSIPFPRPKHESLRLCHKQTSKIIVHHWVGKCLIAKGTNLFNAAFDLQAPCAPVGIPLFSKCFVHNGGNVGSKNDSTASLLLCSGKNSKIGFSYNLQCSNFVTFTGPVSYSKLIQHLYVSIQSIQLISTFH